MRGTIFVAYFPGVYWYDTSWQLMEYYDPSVPFTDHHPFMMTYLYVGFADIGKALFNNAIYGLYLLVLVQSQLQDKNNKGQTPAQKKGN